MRIIIAASCVVGLTLSVSIEHSFANPTGGSVVGGDGNATITGQGTALTTINQSANQVIINWQNFSIGAGEITRFVQPSDTAAALNRVTSGNPSQIYGSLQANGRVFVINPNGILVGPSGQIDTKGFVASTLDVPDASFLSGANLILSGNSSAAVRNEGSIQALGGDVYLIAHSVENDGTINAPQGTVGLAAGSQVQLVQSGDEHLSVLAGNSSAPATAVGVNNSGTIQAASAELKSAGGNIYALAINNGGVIRATGIVNKNGHIYLAATGGNIQNSGTLAANNADGSGGTIIVDGGHNAAVPATVINSGTIEARGDAAGSKGGTVELLGDDVGLFDNAVVDVSGDSGGGTALIGGGLHGANAAIQNAQRTYIAPEAVVNANALTRGNGGNVVVWSDEVTRFYGSIDVRGGAAGGDGGDVEVSSHNQLDFNGSVDAMAPNGAVGTLLLDPHNLEVLAGDNTGTIPTGFNDPTPDGDSAVGDQVIANQLTSVNVTLFANNNITFDANAMVAPSSGTGNLTVKAGNSILFGNGASVTLRGSFSATFNDGEVGVTPADRDAGPATFTMNTGSSITAPGGITITAGGLTQSSDGAGGTTTPGVDANTGNISLTSLSTKPADAATGVAGGDITVMNNVASSADISVLGTIDASGSDANGAGAHAGGDGGTVTLNASGTLNAGTIMDNGGSGTGGGAGGAGGAVNLTAGAGITATSISTIGNTTGNNGNAGAGGAVGLTAGAAITVGSVTTSGANGTGSGNGGKAGDVTFSAGTGVTANGAIAAEGGSGAPGGAGGTVNLTATAGSMTVDGISANGGAGSSGSGHNGGDAGSISLTAGTGITLNNNIQANGGVASSGGSDGNANTISLNATAGGVNQAAGALSGAALVLQGAGTFNFNQSANNVATLAAAVNGALSYQNAGNLAIDTVNAVHGVSSSGNAINISTVNGNLQVNNTAAANDVDAGSSTVNLTAGGDNNLLTIASGAKVNGDGGVNLVGDRMTLSGSLTTLGTADLHQNTANRQITLGQDDNNQPTASGGTLGLTSTELNHVTADTLNVGNASSGNVSVNGSIAPSGVTTLSLQSGAAISQQSGNTIGSSGTPLANLALQAGTTISLGEANHVGTLAANAGGTIQYNDADDLTIGSVNGINGVSANNSAISVTTANGALTVNQNVNAGSSTTSLTAGSSGASDNALTVAGGVMVHGAGGVTLVADNMSIDPTATIDGGSATVVLRQSQNGTSIDLGGADGAATLGLSAAELDTVHAGILKVGDANSGNVSVTAAVAPANTTTMSVQSGGTINQTAASTITENNLALRAGTTITLNEANQVGTLAASSSGTIQFKDANGLTVGTADGVAGINTGGSGGVALHTGNTLVIGAGAGEGITAAGHTVTLDADAGGVTEDANIGSKVSAANLLLEGVGDFNLNNANAIGTLAANVNGALSYRDTDGLMIGTVAGTVDGAAVNASGVNSQSHNVALHTGNTLTIGSGVAGEDIVAGAGLVTLDPSAGGVSENLASKVTAGSLLLLGTGPFNLNSANNDLGTLAANVSGAVNYQDLSALMIGTVAGTVDGAPANASGITSGGNNVALTTGGQLTIGTGTAGEDIVAGAGTVTLDPLAGGVSENAASKVTGSGLLLLGSGAFDLNSANNNVATIAANVTGGALTYQDANVLTVGTVGGTHGINSSGNNVTLTTGGQLTIGTGTAGEDIVAGAGMVTLDLLAGGVSENAASKVTGSSLLLFGAGSFGLADANNDVATLAANVAGSVTYNDANGLTIGTVNGTDGINSGGSPINVSTVNGALAVTKGVEASGGTVELAAGSSGNDNPLSISPGVTVHGAGGVTLVADNMAIDSTASINAGSGVAELRPFENGTAINLGGADGAGVLGLAAAELNTVSAGTLRIGDLNSGDINIIGNINPNPQVLSLRSGGSIREAAGFAITVNSLSLLTTPPPTPATEPAIEGTGDGLVVNLFGINNVSRLSAAGQPIYIVIQGVTVDTSSKIDGVGDVLASSLGFVPVNSVILPSGGVPLLATAAKDLAALATVEIPVPRLHTTTFSTASISLDQAAKILPPGSIGTLWLQIPFPAAKEKTYRIEDISKWTSGPIAAMGSTGGPQVPK